MSKIINFARLQVGKPYVFGRSGAVYPADWEAV